MARVLRARSIVVVCVGPGWTTLPQPYLAQDIHYGSHGMELWHSEGTETATVLVKELNPEATSGLQPALNLTSDIVDALLHHFVDDRRHGPELWRTAGTEARTVLNQHVLPGAAGSTPQWLRRVGSRLFWSVGEGMHGDEMWARALRCCAVYLPWAVRGLS